MIIRKALVAVAATSLVFGSTAAAAAAPVAAPVAVQGTRVGSPVEEAEDIRGWAWLILVIGGVAAAILLLTKSSDPVSP